MNNPGKKWFHKKFGWRLPGKFATCTKKSQTKKRCIRADKRKEKNTLDKYYKE